MGGFEEPCPLIPASRLRGAFSYTDSDSHAVPVLLYLLCGPSVKRGDVGQLSCPLPQYLFRKVLRKPFTVLVIETPHDPAADRRIPIFAHQVPVGSHSADEVTFGHNAGPPQLVHDSPQVEVLQGALGEVLPLRELLRLKMTSHHQAVDASQPEVHSHGNADWPSTRDDHLISFCHRSLPAKF